MRFIIPALLVLALVAFSGCTGPGPTACPADAKVCPDGSTVARNPNNNCEFFPCPGAVGCPEDARQCPDGSVIVRDPNNDCQFPECPSIGYSTEEDPLTGRTMLTQESKDELAEAIERQGDIALRALSNMDSLQKLELSYMPVSDISALSTLQNLEELNLSYTSVSDISALSGLSKLSKLNLASTEVSDITPLGGLTSLKILGLGGTPVFDAAVLKGLSGLEYVELNNTNVSSADCENIKDGLPKANVIC